MESGGSLLRDLPHPWGTAREQAATPGAPETTELSLLLPTLGKSLLGLEKAHSLQMGQGF